MKLTTTTVEERLNEYGDVDAEYELENIFIVYM